MKALQDFPKPVESVVTALRTLNALEDSDGPLLDICHALDPVAFARERLDFQPDAKQALVLASRSNKSS